MEILGSSSSAIAGAESRESPRPLPHPRPQNERSGIISTLQLLKIPRALRIPEGGPSQPDRPAAGRRENNRLDIFTIKITKKLE
jgi:hypothetical protein